MFTSYHLFLKIRGGIISTQRRTLWATDPADLLREVVLLSERSLIKMAVMSRKVNLGFEVAPDKREQFLKASSESNAFERAMARAAKNIRNFDSRTVKRKECE